MQYRKEDKEIECFKSQNCWIGFIRRHIGSWTNESQGENTVLFIVVTFLSDAFLSFPPNLYKCSFFFKKRFLSLTIIPLSLKIA